MVRISLLGCGFVATFYMQGLAEVPNQQVVAVSNQQVVAVCRGPDGTAHVRLRRRRPTMTQDVDQPQAGSMDGTGAQGVE